MMRDPRYDILFTPIKIGPHTAKNRFMQVPHCNGMGVHFPRSMAAMRKMKAEGGWGIIFTEETEIHPSSDMSPLHEGRIWADKYIPTYERMVEGIHEHGALAGMQLNHTGHRDAGLYSREAPMSVASHAVEAFNYPMQSRAMDKADIKAYREMHKDAVRNAMRAGFDMISIYVRAGSSLNGIFLSAQMNSRSDEYGGSLENRARLTREVLEDTKELVDGKCAVAIRYTADELKYDDGTTNRAESEDFVSMLADIPDLWDVNAATWSRDSITSRFGEEGHQEELVDFVKKIVPVPVVGVGRFTSPDTMVSQIKRGVLDLIGAARPSIADPFIPAKIENGDIDSIRECIGCNICVTADELMVPLRCTQNPTMGEEYRKGWHPEKVPAKKSDDPVLIVGSGPSGLECALTLHKRGYDVIVAERDDAFGGRVARESLLPGLSAWARVRDHRMQALQVSTTCSMYAQSDLGADEVFEMGCSHVVLATGADWRRDGIGRAHLTPIPVDGPTKIMTPDDVMTGVQPEGPVVIFDDDHYYMGSVMAERLRADGHDVTIVTPVADVSSFTWRTLEQGYIEARLYECGVKIMEKYDLSGISGGMAQLTHNTNPAANRQIECGTVVFVTARLPRDELAKSLLAQKESWADHGIKSITSIGDCVAPSTIAAAVYEGHRFGRELDIPESERLFLREKT